MGLYARMLSGPSLLTEMQRWTGYLAWLTLEVV